MKTLIHLLMKLGLSDYVANQLNKPSGMFGSRFIGRMMNKSNADLEHLSVKCAELKPTDHVLEIGFGNGKLLKELCENVYNGKIYGVDIAEDLIQQVEKRLGTYVKTEKLELHLGGVSRLPIMDNSIDTIITNNTIYFWPQPLADAKELLRVLKPNGKLVCGYRTKEEMERYPFVSGNLDIFKNRYSDEEVKKLFVNAGFSEVTVTVEPSELASSHVAVGIR